MIAKLVEELIYYAKKHLDLDELNSIYIRNILLNRLNENHIYEGEIDFKKIDALDVPDILISSLKEELIKNDFDNIDHLLVEIMGLLTPMPSEVNKKVYELEAIEKGKGLDYLFNLQIKNNYIQKTAIDRNIYFKKDYDGNFIEITINLSKPEKNNKDIAKLLKKPFSAKYPKCLLCIENLGFGGNDIHPARGNIRIVPLKLNNEEWFLQYSPYAYFDHHAIIINKEHHNMSINDNTFIKLLEFINLYPTFFVGSNADLPIVGGSILDHEHYQGGRHLLPVFYSRDRKIIYCDEIIKISIIDWYNSVIRIESKDYHAIASYCKKILNVWKSYSDEDVNIIAYEGDIRHNTITPIARKIGDIYSMNLILRNNRCDEKNPDGIFHAHKEYHNIKQEGIGLIEAMGLFILPPRLKRQMTYVEEILISDTDVDYFYNKYGDLNIHRDMIDKLIAVHGRNLSSMKAREVINDYIADTCKNILCNTAVYKNDNEGQKAFEKFVEIAIK